jgi:competence protein ComEA
MPNRSSHDSSKDKNTHGKKQDDDHGSHKGRPKGSHNKDDGQKMKEDKSKNQDHQSKSSKSEHEHTTEKSEARKGNHKGQTKAENKKETQASHTKHTAEHGRASKGAGININRASAEELMQIEGIDSRMAERIIQFRDEHGKIKNIEELDNIPQIGETRLERLRGAVHV